MNDQNFGPEEGTVATAAATQTGDAPAAEGQDQAPETATGGNDGGNTAGDGNGAPAEGDGA